MRSIVDEEEKEGTDTEITLGMKSLLGVFFGAVLVCGIFFGFGYSLGRGSAHPAATATASPAIAVSPSADSSSPASTDSTSANDSNLKTIVSDQTQPNTPASPSTASATQYDYVPTPNGPARRPVGAPDKGTLRPSPNSAPALAAVTPPTAAAYTKPSAAVVRESQPPPAAASAVAPRAETAALTETRTESPAASTSAGSTMVQIAAVTHQEDATILVSALKRHGYRVVVRNEPNDSLLHVQVGPFASRDQAKAMRARLLADGYNAILK